MICDRAVMVECLRIWHGSVETFEELIRNRIRITLYRQLGGLLFPYCWQLVGGAPFLWGFADLVAARARAGNWREAAYMAAGAFGWWLLLFPFIFQVTLLLANFFHSKADGAWLDQLKTISVAFILALLSFIGNWASYLVHDPLTLSLWLLGALLPLGCVWQALRLQVQQLERRLGVRGVEDRYLGVLAGAR